MRIANRFPLRTLLLLAWPLAAAGCSATSLVAPPTSLERVLAPDSGEAGLAAPDARVDEAWWRAYGDGQLDALVERAFANNLDLAKSALSVRQALNQAYLLGVDLRPRFDAGLSGSWRKNIKDGGPTSQSYGIDSGVGYELDLWGKIRGARDAQLFEASATAEDEASARLALANSVVDAYYHLAYLLDATAAVLDSLAIYEDIGEKARAKVEFGRANPIEADQARQSWLASNATFIDLQAQRKTVEQTLRNLLNLRPGDPLDVVPPTLADFPIIDIDLDMPVSVLSNRPDLRAAEFRLQKAFVNVEIRRKGWYPTVSLAGSLSSSATRIGRSMETPVLGGSVSVDFPFLRPREVRGNLRVSEAEYERARVDFEQTVVSALNELDTYHFAYLRARETLDNSREKYEKDVRVGEHYRANYEEGKNEIDDWLTALNTVLNSRLSTVQNRYKVMQYENLIHQAAAGRYIRSTAE